MAETPQTINITVTASNLDAHNFVDAVRKAVTAAQKRPAWTMGFHRWAMWVLIPVWVLAFAANVFASHWGSALFDLWVLWAICSIRWYTKAWTGR